MPPSSRPLAASHGSREHHREAAEAGGDLLPRALQRQVAEERHAHRQVVLRLGGELLAPRPDALEGDDLAEPLHRVGGMGVQIARHLPRPRAQPIDPRPRQDGRERGVEEERQEHQGERPAEDPERGEHRGRDEDGDEGGRDGVGEEVLDQLDVVGGDADEVARPAPRQIGGGERVELPEHVQAHVGEQPVGHVVGEPRLDPVQEARERRHHGERHEQEAEGLPRLDVLHDERAQHADADQGDDARDAERRTWRRAVRDSPARARAARGSAAASPCPGPGPRLPCRAPPRPARASVANPAGAVGRVRRSRSIRSASGSPAPLHGRRPAPGPP